jgi:hypothetical protein
MNQKVSSLSLTTVFRNGVYIMTCFAATRSRTLSGERLQFVKTVIRGLATIAAFAISDVPHAVSAYELEVHFQVTMWIAELSGFTRPDALEIAKYDQATDDDPATQPYPGPPASDISGHQRRRQYHFVVSARRFDELRQEAFDFDCSSRLNSSAYRRIGYYLHAIEDSYSHRTYGPMWGQGLDGFAPDKPWHVPANFRAMIVHKLVILLDLRGRCAPTSFTDFSRNYARIQGELDRWVQAEQTAGVRGDLDSPLRWEALMSRLYGSERPVYEGAVQEYIGWRDAQKRGGWRK